MACVLQAASAVKLVDATLRRVIIKKRKGSLEVCLMAGRGGVLQANSVLAGYTSLPGLLFYLSFFLSSSAVLLLATGPPMHDV